MSIDVAGMAGQRTITFSSTVRNAKTRRGIPDAEVILLTSGELVRADSAGRFRIVGLSAAPQTALVRRLGYAPQTVEVPEAGDPSRIIDLEPVAKLDSVVVAERAVIATLSTFEDHRHIGLGRFWTRKDLEAYANRTLAEVLAETPGINTTALMRGPHAFVASSRNPGGVCYSQVYLDQALVYRGRGQPFDVNSLRPEQVEAIEYYAGPAELPAKYQGLNANCGVIVIWTRRSP